MSSQRSSRRLFILAAVVVALSFIYCSPPQATAEKQADEVTSSTTTRTATDASMPEHPLRITFLDVGQADALLIQKGDLDILVDAGRYYSGELVKAMDTITDSLDLLIITHPHADHYGGAAGILGEHQVDRIITNGELRGPPRDSNIPATWRDYIAAAEEAGIAFEQWHQGQRIDLTDHLTIEVLADGGEFANTSSGTDINNDSLVMMVEYMGRRLLLPGDIEIAGGEMIVESHCDDGPSDCPALRADIFQAPHHGSHHFDPGFFKATQAEWAVFGSPFDNRQHHHPRIETVQALMDQGARIKSTNQGGGQNVVATIDIGGGIDWNIEDPEIFVWLTEPDPNVGQICQLITDEDGTTAECERH